MGVGTTAGPLGTLGPPLYETWKNAEDAVRKMFAGVSKAFDTPYGRRIVDCFSGRVAREVKYGAQTLSSFIENQIAKDIWLLESGVVDSVEWHFFKSAVSNTGGPSDSLLAALLNAGFTVIFH